MNRAVRIIVLTLGIGCRARVLGVAQADVPFFEPEPTIRPSKEPFVENPRFCLPGAPANACREYPIEC